MMMLPAQNTENEIAGLLTQEQRGGAAWTRARFLKGWLNGRVNVAASRALLVLTAGRGEKASELLTVWKAIRESEKTAVPFRGKALDTCGTGGDHSNSLNLSTLSSLVMAAAGVTVLKHGNRAITSKCGSSDLLEAFGMNLAQKPKGVLASARQTGMGYFHAPAVHPVYARFQAVRRTVRCRTFFNLLGPLLNPVTVTHQILGLASKRYFDLYADLLPRIGRKRALIFQGAGGMDEITSLGTTRGVVLLNGRSKSWMLRPQSFGLRTGKKSDLEIQSVAHAKLRAIQVLKNKDRGAARDSVLLNAACGIWLAEMETDLKPAYQRAEKALSSGRAWQVLNRMTEFSKK